MWLLSFLRLSIWSQFFPHIFFRMLKTFKNCIALPSLANNGRITHHWLRRYGDNLFTHATNSHWVHYWLSVFLVTMEKNCRYNCSLKFSWKISIKHFRIAHDRKSLLLITNTKLLLPIWQLIQKTYSDKQDNYTITNEDRIISDFSDLHFHVLHLPHIAFC